MTSSSSFSSLFLSRPYLLPLPPPPLHSLLPGVHITPRHLVSSRFVLFTHVFLCYYSFSLTFIFFFIFIAPITFILFHSFFFFLASYLSLHSLVFPSPCYHSSSFSSSLFPSSSLLITPFILFFSHLPFSSYPCFIFTASITSFPTPFPRSLPPSPSSLLAERNTCPVHWRWQ